jgi:hypothetical protein
MRRRRERGRLVHFSDFFTPVSNKQPRSLSSELPTTFCARYLCARTNGTDRREYRGLWLGIVPRKSAQQSRSNAVGRTRCSIIKHVVNDLDNFAVREIDQEQIRPVAHPLKVGRRRRQAEQVPIRVLIIAHQENRWQERTDLPAWIAPAGRIDIWSTAHALECTSAIKELRPAGTAKFRPRMRLTGADKLGARMRLTRVDKLGTRMRLARADKLGARMRLTRVDKLGARMWPARPNKLGARVRPATGIDDLRSRRRAGVRPAPRNKRLRRRRTTSWMLLRRRTPAATMVIIALGQSRAGQR